MSADVPRAAITNIFFAEIMAPLLLVAVTTLPYLFINAQTGVLAKNQKDDNEDIVPTGAFVRVLIVSFAPIAVNAGMLAVLFAMACFMGPLLSMCCKKFGSVLAGIAHAVSVISLIIFFEAMYLMESFSFARTLSGMIAVVAMQRFFLKLIVSLALTREMKTDQSNIAFWTGKWYSMGWHSVSQPAREFLCKITELSMFAADFVLGHWLLFMMLPFVTMPKVDVLHSIMLFWLRPSRQIRPPIYSLKQSKLRRRRVIRFAILYYVLLVLFLALLIGPSVAKNAILEPLGSIMGTIDGLGNFRLIQPNGQNKDNTNSSSLTGTGFADYTGFLYQSTKLAAELASATGRPTDKIKLF